MEDCTTNIACLHMVVVICFRELQPLLASSAHAHHTVAVQVSNGTPQTAQVDTRAHHARKQRSKIDVPMYTGAGPNLSMLIRFLGWCLCKLQASSVPSSAVAAAASSKHAASSSRWEGKPQANAVSEAVLLRRRREGWIACPSTVLSIGFQPLALPLGTPSRLLQGIRAELELSPCRPGQGQRTHPGRPGQGKWTTSAPQQAPDTTLKTLPNPFPWRRQTTDTHVTSIWVDPDRANGCTWAAPGF